MLSIAMRTVALFWLLTGTGSATQVHLMPAGPMVADGETPVTLHIWIPSLVEADRVKVKPAHGRILATERHAGGMVAVRWVPARESSPTQVPVLVTVKPKGGDGSTMRLEAALVPPREGGIEIETTPNEWEPGMDAVQLKLRLWGTSDQQAGDRRISLSASVGDLTEAVPLGDGTFSARWTPPSDIKQARTAIISAIDQAAPSQIFGWTTVAILAQQSLTFGATPDSQNTLRIGDREYGPMTASPAGTVAFSALVHPAIRSGTMRSHLPNGQTLNVPSALPLAEYPRVAFLAQPTNIPIGATHTVLVVATQPDGEPLREAEITIASGEAKIGTAEPTDFPGVYALTMKIDGPARDLDLNVKMRDAKALITKLQRAETRVRVINGLPSTKLELSPDPLPLEGRELMLTATIQDESGVPVRSSLPGMVAMPARALARPTSRGDGRYQFKVRPEGDVVVGATVPRLNGSSMTTAHVVIWPASAAVETGGEVPILVAAVDAFGIPIPNIAFTLSVPNGGTFPEKVKSGANGIALTTYKASNTPGLFTINTGASGLVAQTSIFHGDLQASPGPVRSGDSSTIRHRTNLENAVGIARVSREEAEPVAVAAVPVAVAFGADDVPPPTASAAPAAPEPTPAPVPQPTTQTPGTTTPTQANNTKPPKEREPKPTPGKSGASDSDRSGTQLGIALQSVMHQFKQTTDSAAGSEATMPSEASFFRPVSPGMVLDVHHRSDDTALGLNGEFRIYNDVIAVGDMLHGYSNWSAQLGVRYALNVAPDWAPFVFGAAHRAQTSIFRFVDAAADTDSESDEPTDGDETGTESTESLNQFVPAVEALYGVRVGGGIQREIPGDMLLVASISEMLAPYPIATEIRSSVTQKLNADWAFRGAVELNLKHVGMSIDGVPLKVRDTEMAVSAGVVYHGL